MTTLLQKHEDIRRAANKAISEHKSLNSLSEQVLTDVVLQTLKKYQQKLNVGIEDSITDLLDAFKLKVVETIFDTASSWQVAVRPPILFPKNCRHCYTRGHSTVVVIEQDPQTRSLLFEKDMLAPNSLSRRASLAFPYVIFILHFRDEIFSGVYCGWRKAPLRSLDDILCRPVLPNIHENLAVCMGHSGYAVGANISQQCESVVSNFWNSQFNGDLSQAWDSKSSFHSSLRTGETWERQSAVDPMFILEANFTENRSVQYIIDLLVLNEETPDISSLRHALTDQLDDCVLKLFSRILRYFKKTKFEKHFPKDVENQLKEALNDSLKEFSDLLMCLEHDVKDLGDKVKTPVSKIEPIGSFWHNYST